MSFNYICHQEQNQMALGQLRGAAAPNMAMMEQSRMLAHTLSQNTNPKFQVSFLMHFTQNNFKTYW